ncbi:MAG: hypothetical protein WC856_23390 [Methylococcaceae bacterium]|jgi:hypothetical protein
MDDGLNLIIGKPELGDNEKIATFTRFVLPFAFQLQSAPELSGQTNLFYTLNDKTDLSYIKRKKYFTRETADTLYERGQWLSMCDAWSQTAWGKAEITVTLREQPFKIGMLPPQIVLFELPEIKEQETSAILQTGFLYVDAYFPEQQNKHPQLDDLLVLNEFFRYFGIPYEAHAEIIRNIFANVPIRADSNETIASLDELGCYFERWANMLEIPIQSKNHYYRLFPQNPAEEATQNWAKAAREWMYNNFTDKNAEHWQIYADNRCYVWTVAFLEKGGETLKSEYESGKTTLEAKDYGHWIKLLNVDNPPNDWATKKYKGPKETHKSVNSFEREWAEERTYKRWEQGGAWYGFCYHSSAILAPPISFIFSPTATYYFDTTLLLLYIRMSLFRFGRELSQAIQDNNEKTKMEKFRQLRNEFSSFTVLYQFPLLSNQQQSIEMYEINRKFLDIDQFFDEIQKEVDNLHQFYELVEANNQAKTANNIGKSTKELAESANNLATLGIPLATGGLVTALFSMTDRNLWQCIFQDIECTANSDLFFQALIVLVIGIFIGFLMRNK